MLQEFFNSINQGNLRKKLKNIINSALEKATVLDKIKKNPMLSVEVAGYKKIKRRAFEFIEQNNIINLLPPKYKSLFYFLCCTGLRIGEFLALTPEDIDYDKEVIHITKSMRQRTKEISKPKTDESIRDITFIKSLMNETIKLNNNENFIGTYDYEIVKRKFKQVFDKLGISNVSIHSTRHTFASVCYFAEIKDKLTQKWLGHTTIDMTLNTYTDLINKGDSPILNYIKELKKATD